jgi:hypothetical protein
MTGVITEVTFALDKFDSVSPGWIDGVAAFGTDLPNSARDVSMTRALICARQLTHSNYNLKEVAVMDSSLNELFAKPLLPLEGYVPPRHVTLCLFRVHEQHLSRVVADIKQQAGHVLWAQEGK